MDQDRDQETPQDNADRQEASNIPNYEDFREVLDTSSTNRPQSNIDRQEASNIPNYEDFREEVLNTSSTRRPQSNIDRQEASNIPNYEDFREVLDTSSTRRQSDDSSEIIENNAIQSSPQNNDILNSTYETLNLTAGLEKIIEMHSLEEVGDDKDSSDSSDSSSASKQTYNVAEIENLPEEELVSRLEPIATLDASVSDEELAETLQQARALLENNPYSSMEGDLNSSSGLEEFVGLPSPPPTVTEGGEVGLPSGETQCIGQRKRKLSIIKEEGEGSSDDDADNMAGDVASESQLITKWKKESSRDLTFTSEIKIIITEAEESSCVTDSVITSVSEIPIGLITEEEALNDTVSACESQITITEVKELSSDTESDITSVSEIPVGLITEVEDEALNDTVSACESQITITEVKEFSSDTNSDITSVSEIPVGLITEVKEEASNYTVSACESRITITEVKESSSATDSDVIDSASEIKIVITEVNEETTIQETTEAESSIDAASDVIEGVSSFESEAQPSDKVSVLELTEVDISVEMLSDDPKQVSKSPMKEIAGHNMEMGSQEQAAELYEVSDDSDESVQYELLVNESSDYEIEHNSSSEDIEVLIPMQVMNESGVNCELSSLIQVGDDDDNDDNEVQQEVTSDSETDSDVDSEGVFSSMSSTSSSEEENARNVVLYKPYEQCPFM